jgi:hypothetical protein
MQKPKQEKMVWKDRYENDPNVPPLYYWYLNETVCFVPFPSNDALFGAIFRPIEGRSALGSCGVNQ